MFTIFCIINKLYIINEENRKKNKFRKYEVGSLILIKAMTERQRNKKLMNRYYGPYMILKQKSLISYIAIKVKKDDYNDFIGKRIFVNVRNMKPYYGKWKLVIDIRIINQSVVTIVIYVYVNHHLYVNVLI